MHASLVLLAAAQLAAAHFGIEYPEWRADTLTDEDGPYSQYDYPCEFPKHSAAMTLSPKFLSHH